MNAPTTTQNLTGYALRLAELGYYVMPIHEIVDGACTCGKDCDKPGKHPRIRWRTGNPDEGATTDPERIRAWWGRWPTARVGVDCGKSGIFCLDIDSMAGHGVDGYAAWELLEDTYGRITPGPQQQTPSGGKHILFKQPPGRVIRNTTGSLPPGLDVRGEGGLFVTGPGYTWLEGHKPGVPIPEAPAWLVAAITDSDRDNGDHRQREPIPDRIPRGQRNQTLTRLAGAMRRPGASVESIEAALLRENELRCDPPLPPEEVRAISASVGRYPPRPEPVMVRGELQSFELDDIGNGERLVSHHGKNLRYVHEWGWLVWNGRYWQADRGEVAAMAKSVARLICLEAADCEDDHKRNDILKHARATAYRSRQEAMVCMAQSEPGIPARPADFDRDPWLFNCTNGTLNLRTGLLQPHDPANMITKVSGTDYDDIADCPTWTRFLDRVFNGDGEIIAFLRRAVGYSLTGSTSAQVLFFLHGTGANGKTTFTDTLLAMLGDYAAKTPTDTLMTKYTENGVPNDLARLAGARAVIAAELAEGKRLNESLVKDLTGGDRIAARFLHREFFEFTPSFKLWVYGNHKPTIRGTDLAIWRRIKLIPFTVTIPDEEQDEELGAKLQAELPGILNWALDGCLEWQRMKLQTPAQVDAATNTYRNEQDVLGRFLDECCVFAPDATVTAGELHAAYKTWGGEYTQKRFSQALTERGYTANFRDGRGRKYYKGLGLIAIEKSEPSEPSEPFFG